jgi:hypothetical protein
LELVLADREGMELGAVGTEVVVAAASIQDVVVGFPLQLLSLLQLLHSFDSIGESDKQEV